MIEGVTEKTRDLVVRWISAKQSLDRINRQRDQTSGELDAAENEIGKWLCPADAGVDEHFNIWYGSGILCATPTTSQGDAIRYKVMWRKKPDAKQLGEQGM